VADPVAYVVLDNEAVQALSDVAHPKHRRALVYVEAVAQRRQRRPRLDVMVPVAVRVEAGWDRTSPSAALVNQISGAVDADLAGDGANRATQVRAALGVSVVDATVAEAAERGPKPVAILTSDADDMNRVAGYLDGEVRVIAL
jgi:hypothetical protein